MDHMSEIERGQDLSSFAMLLLESELHSSDVNRYSPADESYDAELPQANGVWGIRNFFRKHHKSIGGSNGVGGSSNHNHGGIALNRISAKEDSVASSSKIRNLFVNPGSNRQRSKSDVSGAAVLCSTSAPRAHVKMEMDGSATFAMEVEDRNSGDGGYGSVPKSPINNLQNVYKTPPNQHLLARRSVSVRDSPIGPNEFLEMYRSRAYSDSPLPDQSRIIRNRVRRFSASPPFSPNSVKDYCPFEPRQLIIWRDNNSGTQVFRLPSTDEEDGLDIGDFIRSEDHVYLRFLKMQKCYDVIPTSSKMVVLDTQLNVKKAFYALTNNGMRAAPLWDTIQQKFIGMLTISDFIKVLLKFHKTQLSNMEDIEDQTISNWTDILTEYRTRPLVYVEPDACMLEAVRKLCLHKIHRLPVIDKVMGNVLYILTHKRLLRYVFYFFQSLGLPQPSFMNKSLNKLHLGTYGNIAVVQPETHLVEALELFVARRVSSLPVVDANNKLLGLFTKHHIMNLAAEKTYSNLSGTVEKALMTADFESLQFCKKSETLGTILERLVKTEVHRLIIVDEMERLEGILSLSDVLRYLVVRPSSADLDLRKDEFGGKK